MNICIIMVIIKMSWIWERAPEFDKDEWFEFLVTDPASRIRSGERGGYI